MITADEAQSGLLPDNTEEELSSESSSDSETAEREETSTVDTLLTHRRNQRLSVNNTTTASAAGKQTTESVSSERWQGSMLTRAKAKQANQQRARTVLLDESASKHIMSNSKKRQGEEKTKQTVGAHTRVTPGSKKSSQKRRDLAIEEGASSTRRVVTLDEAPPLPVSHTPAAVSSHNTAVSESDNRCLQVNEVIL